ncbi:MAG: HAD family hydrolase [Clostridiales bacterium]|nr:HAD family hydrolase [Clostridiales bacterium]
MQMILFDLDGTLLPMNQDEFTNGYFQFLAGKMSAYGYEPKKLIESVWAGTAAMVKNDGSCSNETAFWRTFTSIYGEKSMADIGLFEDFYRGDFQKAKMFCEQNPEAVDAVRRLKGMGYRVALATNPLFPAIATESRIRWAGLKPEDFEWYTTYENIGYCKPNPVYYLEMAKHLDVAPGDCLMVGNDVDEDMIAAQKAGMDVFLLTDCLLNRKDKDISAYPQGSFMQLMEYVTIQGTK